MKKQIFIICFVISLLSPSYSFASPQINEFYSSTSDDWVEIYNPDPDPVDMSIYKIKDSTDNNKLDLSGVVSPQGFMVFEWANKLNNGGDIIKLVQISDNSVVDQVTYGNQGGLIEPGINQSAGRISDGASSWTIFSTASKNSSNNSSPTFTPPTPTPSKTPTPTKTPPTPKPTVNTSTKSPAPIKSSTAISVVSKSSTKASSNLVNSDKIAQTFRKDTFVGIRNLTETPKISNKTEVLGATSKKFPLLIVLGGLLLFTGVLLFSLRYISVEEIYEKIFNK